MKTKSLVNLSFVFFAGALSNATLAGVPESMEKNAVVEDVLVTGVRSSGSGMPTGTVAGGSLGGSRGYSPGQSEGQDAKVATQRKRECEKQKNLEIEAVKDACLAGASTYKAKEYSSCPIETSFETEINVIVGRGSVATSPRATCIENVNAVVEAKVSGCNADASKSKSKVDAACR